MTKFKQTYKAMVQAHPQLFAEFKVIHDHYVQDRKAWSAAFHEKGAKVVEVIREYERRLCSAMERGNYAQYSSKVAEKFWNEIKKEFTRIEFVGVKSNLD
jgi:hypothetical protein